MTSATSGPYAGDFGDQHEVESSVKSVAWTEVEVRSSLACIYGLDEESLMHVGDARVLMCIRGPDMHVYIGSNWGVNERVRGKLSIQKPKLETDAHMRLVQP